MGKRLSLSLWSVAVGLVYCSVAGLMFAPATFFSKSKLWERQKEGVMKKHTTNCIVCWKQIEVSFNPPIKKFNCIELICCNKKTKKNRSKILGGRHESK